jgi:hypothetical protein
MIFQSYVMLCVTEFQIFWNGGKWKLLTALMCQTKVHLRDHSMWNLNSTVTYHSFESFWMYRFYLCVIDDLTWSFWLLFIPKVKLGCILSNVFRIQWLRICSICRNYTPVFSLWMTYQRVFNKSNTAGAHVEQELLTRSEYLSSPPLFSWVRVARSLILCAMFCSTLFALLSFSFGHCSVCP